MHLHRKETPARVFSLTRSRALKSGLSLSLGAAPSLLRQKDTASQRLVDLCGFDLAVPLNSDTILFWNCFPEIFSEAALGIELLDAEMHA